MKQFNQNIQVQVSVDSIANKLLSTMKEEFEHRDMLVEAIIGSALNSGTLLYIYNALNGFGNEINFQVGQIVECTKNIYRNAPVPGVDNPWKSQYVPIGTCEIVEIDLYRSDKLRVHYCYELENGNTKEDSMWVEQTTCDGSDLSNANAKGKKAVAAML